MPPQRTVSETEILGSERDRGGYPLRLDPQATRPISPSNPPLLRKFHYRTTKVPEYDLQQNSIFEAIAVQKSTLKLKCGQSERCLCMKTWSNQVRAVSVRQPWNVKCLRYIETTKFVEVKQKIVHWNYDGCPLFVDQNDMSTS